MRRQVDGFSLIEVMVAVLVLSLVLTGVVGAVLHARLRAVTVTDRVQAAGDRSTADQSANTPSWMWGGPRVARASWVSDEALDVRASALVPTIDGSAEPTHGSPEATLGVWVDGWFAGEVAVDADGATRIGPGSPGCEDWPEASTGAQVSLRVRTEDGAWGTPWRTVTRSDETTSGDATDLVAGVTVHLPVAAALSMGIELDGVALTISPDAVVDLPNGGAVSVPFPGGTRARLTVGSHEQEIGVENGRWVDVYF